MGPCVPSLGGRPEPSEVASVVAVPGPGALENFSVVFTLLVCLFPDICVGFFFLLRALSKPRSLFLDVQFLSGY